MDLSDLTKLAVALPGYALGFASAWLIHRESMKTLNALLTSYKELAESRGEAGNACKKVLEQLKRLESTLDGRKRRSREEDP